MSFLSGMTLLLPAFKIISLRRLLILSAFLPLTSFAWVGGDYYASGYDFYSLVIMLPYVLSYVILFIAFLKNFKQRIKIGLIYIPIQVLLIAWSAYITFIAMHDCFMGACA